MTDRFARARLLALTAAAAAAAAIAVQVPAGELAAVAAAAPPATRDLPADLPAGPVRPIPHGLSPEFTPEGRAFPVAGGASFGGTFGADRAGVGWHHGEDLFAPWGTAVLAVADGAVFSAGWNDRGGYRFWLRDGDGTGYYYAHLSAFSPLAANSGFVRAGDVLGFVGASGDAEGTPPHLHFEIHPASLRAFGYDGVVDPAPFLSAWKRRADLPLLQAAPARSLASKRPG
jgi:murein DD-endopeptidase MepM/ murein hydrolase activator NlpD